MWIEVYIYSVQAKSQAGNNIWVKHNDKKGKSFKILG